MQTVAKILKYAQKIEKQVMIKANRCFVEQGFESQLIGTASLTGTETINLG